MEYNFDYLQYQDICAQKWAQVDILSKSQTFL